LVESCERSGTEDSECREAVDCQPGWTVGEGGWVGFLGCEWVVRGEEQRKQIITKQILDSSISILLAAIMVREKA
jgi:hypothetical protein